MKAISYVVYSAVQYTVIRRTFAGKKSSKYKSDGPSNVQPSDADPSSKSGSHAGEDLHKRLAALSVEDVPGYVPPLPSVSSDAHEKADMLIAYATVKGMITLKTDRERG